MDHMRGLIHIKDVCLREEVPLAELVRPIPFLPESASAQDALRLARDAHRKTAFVVDEHGAVVGLVTVEDLLEEIVGDIADEYDADQAPDVQEMPDGSFVIRGRLSVRDWAERFELEPPQTEVDTVGGLVTALLEHIPAVGEQVRCGRALLTVEEVGERRVTSLRMDIRTPGPGQEDVDG
jgi:CBS domain containing-hemolysin-like protein